MSVVAHTIKTISLAASQRVLSAAVESAGQVKAPLTIVVVDQSGLVVASARMDGAPVVAFEVACRKAWTSAVTRSPTDGVHQFISSDSGSLLSMPHIPNFSVIAGGVPLLSEGECIGAVGVSGATSELDLQVALAAAKAL
jgi:uncharacterized protein GlcG (DUF336 family)